jgi:hypothetical protein
MKSSRSEASPSPNVHSKNIQRELSQLIDHLEADIRRVDDERFRRLLEKSGEVLKSLRTLFERFGSGGNASRDQRSTSGSHQEKNGERTPAPVAKGGENKKSAPRPKSEATAAGAVRKNPATNPTTRAAKAGEPPRKRAAASQSVQPTTTAQPAPRATAKPQDPDEITAKAQQQRREARAPKMPGGHNAPRPAPPQSGKPVWSKPHSP